MAEEKLPIYNSYLWMQLEETANKLNEVSDDFTKEIIRIQDKLNKLNLGVEAFHKIDNDLTIGYTKYSDKGWCLISLTARNKIPLASASRDVRIKAIEHIASLFYDLKSNTENLLLQIEEAKNELEKANANIR